MRFQFNPQQHSKWTDRLGVRAGHTPLSGSGWFSGSPRGQDSGTACPCGATWLYQCLVFLSRDCPDHRSDMAQHRATPSTEPPHLALHQVYRGPEGERRHSRCRPESGSAQLRCHSGGSHTQPSRLVKACQEASLNQMCCLSHTFSLSTPEAGRQEQATNTK